MSHDQASTADRPGAVSRLKGWFLDRSGFAILNAFGDKQLSKPVPTRLSWLYTTGALAMFYFGLQILTGCLLLTVYVPEESAAYGSVQVIDQQANLGWLIRQCHSWGASFIVIVLGLHMFKVLWNGTYKRPREFTWFVGCVLFGLTLGFCFSGYLLPWDQLSFWATRVGIEAVDSLPFAGKHIKTFICGGEEVSGATLGRFFALHVFVLPALLIVFVSWHLALITWKGISPKTSVTVEAELGNVGALRQSGSESFFPRQIYRDLIACTIGFALLVTIATFYPFHLHPPADPFSTPPGIKPEWYFLPAYQFLKYFDDNLYNALPFLETMNVAPDFLGVMTINAVCGVLFLLPILDRGKERKLRKRPIFAIFAFLLLVGVVGMGVLGFLSERENVQIFGRYYHFDTKGAWTVTEQPIAHGEGAHGEGSLEGAGAVGDGSGETSSDAAQGSGKDTESGDKAESSEKDASDESKQVPSGKGEESEGESPDTGSRGTDDASDESEGDADDDNTDKDDADDDNTDKDDADDDNTDKDDTDDDNTEKVDADDDNTDKDDTDGGDAVASVTKMSGAGNCVSCHYDGEAFHGDPHEEWAGSVHAKNDVGCAQCHGGNEEAAPEKLIGLLEELIESEEAEWPDEIETEENKRLYLWAHRGIQLSRRGEPAAPRSKEVPDFCGKCHSAEAEFWKTAKVEHSKNCKNCHSNHAVRPVGEFLYTEDGYTEEGEEATVAFREIRKEFDAMDAALAACKALLDSLEKEGYPIDGAVEEKQRFDAIVQRVKNDLRPMVHSLDAEAVKSKATSLREPLEELTASMQAIVDSRDQRWIFVAGAWAMAVIFTLLFALKLRSIGPPPAAEGVVVDIPGAGGGSGAISGATTERDALLHPLSGGSSDSAKP